MADIARYPFVRHLRGTATTHIEHVKGGRTVHRGTGQSFWFRPLSAVLSEVPVDDRELPLFFHARAADFRTSPSRRRSASGSSIPRRSRPASTSPSPPSGTARYRLGPRRTR